MKAFAAFSILFALLVAAGAQENVGRKFLSAPAPGPMPHQGVGIDAARDPRAADLLFILSANQAVFTTATTLQLTGVTTTVQFHDAYDKGSKAGLIRTAVFANGTTGARYVSADGTWLSTPDAALIGSANNSDANSNTAVLLTLGNPIYDAAAKSVTFTIAVLPAEESALKTLGGITNGLVVDHANGVGTPLVTAVTPGAALTDVALFIDTSKAALTPLAEEKYWWQPWGGWGGWGGGWGGWGGGWGHGGWGWGWGWGR